MPARLPSRPPARPERHENARKTPLKRPQNASRWERNRILWRDISKSAPWNKQKHATFLLTYCPAFSPLFLRFFSTFSLRNKENPLLCHKALLTPAFGPGSVEPRLPRRHLGDRALRRVHTIHILEAVLAHFLRQLRVTAAYDKHSSVADRRRKRLRKARQKKIPEG